MANREEDAPPIVCDFGFARLPDYPDLHADSRIGTYSYMAPEIYESKSYGPPCDVWALGVVLYTMLSGYPPFWVEDENNVAALSQLIIDGSFYFHDDVWSGISDTAKALICGMLNTVPEERFTLERVLRDPWFDVTTPTRTVHLAASIVKLKQFNAKRRFRAAACTVVWGARHSTASRALKSDVVSSTAVPLAEISAIRAAFKHEVGAGATVNCTSFRHVMTGVGYGALPLDRVFEVFDVDGSGECDLREVLCGFATLRAGDTEEGLKMAFDIYDLDGSGSLTADEVFRLLLAAGLPGVAVSISSDECTTPEVKATGPGADGETDSGTAYADALAARLTRLFEEIDASKDGKGACIVARRVSTHT